MTEQLSNILIDAVVTRTVDYLRDELGLDAQRGTVSGGELKDLVLRDLLTVIGMGGAVNCLVSFSFDRKLIEKIFEISTEGLRISADERSAFIGHTAAETINVILGHATADLSHGNEGVTLTPPAVIEDASKVCLPQGAGFRSVPFVTKFGDFNIDFILPNSLSKSIFKS